MLGKNVARVEQLLAELYPDAHCELVHANPYQLLVATVLSAQTTDKRVNTVTGELFDRYPDAAALAQANPDELAAIVKPLGFGNRRTEQLLGLGARLVRDYGGQVPDSRDALVTLPGVGRKTANVVLGNCFDQPAITVDTHVGRLARRLGWTTKTRPEQVEEDLMELLTPATWTVVCHRLIWHGRAVCHARKPQCSECALAPYCPAAQD